MHLIPRTLIEALHPRVLHPKPCNPTWTLQPSPNPKTLNCTLDLAT